LTLLDLNNNRKLKYLRCGSNKLDSMVVCKNTGLTTLVCDNNQLTSLDLSTNEALVILSIQSNKFNVANLNKTLSSLHDNIIENESKVIFMAGNPGINNYHKSILKPKGWRLSTTLIFNK